MFLCSFIADLLVKTNQIYMSHEEEAAELYPIVGCYAKAARLILLSARAIKNGPQALNSVCVYKFVVLPCKVRCCATLPVFPLETKFGIKCKTDFCCCSRVKFPAQTFCTAWPPKPSRMHRPSAGEFCPKHLKRRAMTSKTPRCHLLHL